MNQKFEKIKKLILDSLDAFQNRINESNTFNLLNEKYQILPVLQKNLLKYGFLILILCGVIFIPLSHFYSSLSSWSEFQEKRKLSLKLLKIRNHTRASLLGDSEFRMQRKISDIVGKYENEKYLITKKTFPFFKKIKKIKKSDFEVEVKHLNVRQLIRLGTDFASSSQVPFVLSCDAGKPSLSKTL